MRVSERATHASGFQLHCEQPLHPDPNPSFSIPPRRPVQPIQTIRVYFPLFSLKLLSSSERPVVPHPSRQNGPTPRSSPSQPLQPPLQKEPFFPSLTTQFRRLLTFISTVVIIYWLKAQNLAVLRVVGERTIDSTLSCPRAFSEFLRFSDYFQIFGFLDFWIILGFWILGFWDFGIFRFFWTF